MDRRVAAFPAMTGWGVALTPRHGEARSAAAVHSALAGDTAAWIAASLRSSR